MFLYIHLSVLEFLCSSDERTGENQYDFLYRRGVENSKTKVATVMNRVSQNVYVEPLTSKVTVFGERVFIEIIKVK